MLGVIDVFVVLVVFVVRFELLFVVFFVDIVVLFVIGLFEVGVGSILFPDWLRRSINGLPLLVPTDLLTATPLILIIFLFPT